MKAVVKLGGAVITRKEEVQRGNLQFRQTIEEITAFSNNYTRMDNLSRLAKEISKAKKENTNLEIIIANGAGPYGHELVRNGAHYETIHQSVKLLNTIVRGVLRKYGVKAVEVSPYDYCGTAIRPYNVRNLVKSILGVGRGVASSYGDVVPFNPSENDYEIISADDIIVEVGEKWRADIVVAVTDVDGYYKKYGTPNAKLIRTIHADRKDIELDAVSEVYDATGGMAKKVEKLVSFTKKTGINSTLINGNKEGNLKKTLGGEELGTTIKNGN